MKLGIASFPAEYAIRPDELAQAVEERGFVAVLHRPHPHPGRAPAGSVGGRLGASGTPTPVRGDRASDQSRGGMLTRTPSVGCSGPEPFGPVGPGSGTSARAPIEGAEDPWPAW